MAFLLGKNTDDFEPPFFWVGNVVVGDLSFMKYSMFWEDVDVEFFSTKTFFSFGFIVEP